MRHILQLNNIICTCMKKNLKRTSNMMYMRHILQLNNMIGIGMKKNSKRVSNSV